MRAHVFSRIRVCRLSGNLTPDKRERKCAQPSGREWERNELKIIFSLHDDISETESRIETSEKPF